MSEAYQPREYKSVASARRAGRRECMARGIVPFRVITLGAIYLVVGAEELAKFEAWIIENQIPINWKRDSYVTYVWGAIFQKQSGSAATPPNGARDIP